MADTLPTTAATRRSLPRRGVAAALFAALLLSELSAPTSLSAAAPYPPSFADLVERVAPAVVNISTAKEIAGEESLPVPQFPPGSPFEEFFKEFFDRKRQQRQRRSVSLGSGFIIDPAGYVVTNNHVIADADEITVILWDNSEYKAKLVGYDPKTDLALLKIDRPEPFPYVEWADSDKVRVGDWMIAIGNPFGLGSSVTAGIVSARGRDIRTGPYDDYFQVDAAINRGNSGGPSFTVEGKVFGVNTAIFSPSGGNVGIGFAIPSNLARRVVESLKATGRVVRAWLGVRIQTVTDEIAESLGLEGTYGALVASAVPGGPAAAAGIEPGDVILEFAGQRIDSMRSLPRLVAETPVGREVEVVIWRRGERRTVKVTLAELPSDEQLAATQEGGSSGPSSVAEIPELGIRVAAVDDELRQRFQLAPDMRGVVVVEVAPDSPAGREGLQPGDVILEVNQEEVASPPEILARLLQAKQEGKQSLLLLVNRGGDPQFVVLRFAG
ncbi:Periplasmic serine endoprotease DegP [bacterium HR40]|nr:Periplasmic serine endoprotease DegP [bacterium HR40]